MSDPISLDLSMQLPGLEHDLYIAISGRHPTLLIGPAPWPQFVVTALVRSVQFRSLQLWPGQGWPDPQLRLVRPVTEDVPTGPLPGLIYLPDLLALSAGQLDQLTLTLPAYRRSPSFLLATAAAWPDASIARRFDIILTIEPLSFSAAKFLRLDSAVSNVLQPPVQLQLDPPYFSWLNTDRAQAGCQLAREPSFTLTFTESDWSFLVHIHRTLQLDLLDLDRLFQLTATCQALFPDYALSVALAMALTLASILQPGPELSQREPGPEHEA